MKELVLEYLLKRTAYYQLANDIEIEEYPFNAELEKLTDETTDLELAIEKQVYLHVAARGNVQDLQAVKDLAYHDFEMFLQSIVQGYGYELPYYKGGEQHESPML